MQSPKTTPPSSLPHPHITGLGEEKRQIHNNQDLMGGDQMDKHFAATEDSLKGREGCTCVLGIRLRAGKYHHRPPHHHHHHKHQHHTTRLQHPPPFFFSSSSLSSLHSSQHNWFSLLQFLHKESPPHQGGPSHGWVRLHSLQAAGFLTETILSLIGNLLFATMSQHGEMLFAFGPHARVVTLHPPFVHPAKKEKVTLVISSFTIRARSCPLQMATERQHILHWCNIRTWKSDTPEWKEWF